MTFDNDSPPPIGLFVREDVSKPENRTNLALLGILTIPAFRHWFLGRLGLPPDSIIYPPQNTDGVRPDFVVLGPDSGIRAWIEVELAGENTAQLTEYRNRFAQPVKSIVGPEDAATDTSLEELSRIARDCLDEVLDRQQRQNVQVFVDLVTELGDRSTAWSYVIPNEALQHDQFLQRLGLELGSSLVFGKPPPAPGHLMVTTITQKGWTLRTYAKFAGFTSISVLWKQSSRAMRLPAMEKLANYFGQETVEPYRAFFLERFGLDMSQISGGQSFSVPEEELLEHVADFAHAVQGFIVGSVTNPHGEPHLQSPASAQAT